MNEVDQKFSPEPVTIPFAGLELVPHTSGALWVAEYRALLVADLHFEKASSYAARGVHLPPYDTRATFKLLKKVCADFKPKEIISLGDSFHDDDARSRMDDEIIADLRTFAKTYDVTWITGNHDEAPPVDIGGNIVSEIQLGPLALRHLPTGGLPLFPEIAGHLHPVAVVSQRGKRLRRRCFIANESRMVMPAFGTFTGGLDIRSEPFQELYQKRDFSAWLLGRDQVYRFSARRVTGT